VLSKIVDYVVAAGNIRRPKPDAAKAEKLLLTVFKCILASRPSCATSRRS
jgi:hypothetical protein